MKRIYLSPPHMGAKERSLLLEAFDSNWLEPERFNVELFERDLITRIGVSHAVALSSGTAALHLALILAGVKPGDEVPVSTLTFAATAFAVKYVGARPVLIDSESSTWNMDPNLLEKELHERKGQTKAIIVVDIFGQCADYDPIREICKKYGVALIEDAAEALGATYKGKAAGSLGEYGVFSFNGNKIITTSGGGMLVSDNEESIKKARLLAKQARDQAPFYQHSEVGYNYKLSNLLAAIGRGQLIDLDNRIAARRANNTFYRKALNNVPGVEFMPEASYGHSNGWLSCILIDPAITGVSPEELRLHMESHNIETRPTWKPMHLQPVFSDCRVQGGEVAEKIFQQGLCLPSGSNLTEEDRNQIAMTLMERLKN